MSDPAEILAAVAELRELHGIGATGRWIYNNQSRLYAVLRAAELGARVLDAAENKARPRAGTLTFAQHVEALIEFSGLLPAARPEEREPLKDITGCDV